MNTDLIFKTQLGKDFHFNPEVLDKDSITFVEPELFDSNARKCFYGKPYMNLLYAGNGLVCVADNEIRIFMENYCESAKNEKFRVFDAPQVGYLERELNQKKYTIAHIAVYSIPEENFYRDTAMENVRLYEGKEIEELYETPGFDMALCYDRNAEKKDVLAVTYRVNGEIVAVAGASDDAEDMWQIGIDVKMEYRRKGIAKKLVGILTEEILKRGKLPYYCCAYSNIASLNVAKKCGYKTAWCEITAKPLEEEWIKNILK